MSKGHDYLPLMRPIHLVHPASCSLLYVDQKFCMNGAWIAHPSALGLCACVLLVGGFIILGLSRWPNLFILCLFGWGSSVFFLVFLWPLVKPCSRVFLSVRNE